MHKQQNKEKREGHQVPKTSSPATQLRRGEWKAGYNGRWLRCRSGAARAERARSERRRRLSGGRDYRERVDGGRAQGDEASARRSHFLV